MHPHPVNAGLFHRTHTHSTNTNTKTYSQVTPSGGVHVTLPDFYSPENMGLIVPKTKDGRVVFMLPWQVGCVCVWVGVWVCGCVRTHVG